MRHTVGVICRCKQQTPSIADMVTAILGATPKQFLSVLFNVIVSCYKSHIIDDAGPSGRAV